MQPPSPWLPTALLYTHSHSERSVSPNGVKKMHIFNRPNYSRRLHAAFFLISLVSPFLCPRERKAGKKNADCVLFGALDEARCHKWKINMSGWLFFMQVLTSTTKPHGEREKREISSSWHDCGSSTVDRCSPSVARRKAVVWRSGLLL